MTREALLVANSIDYFHTSRSISVGEIKRTINRLAGLLGDLPNPYRFHITKLFDPSPREVRDKVSSLGDSAARSNSLFLFYYFGHGLLSTDTERELMFLHPKGVGGNQETLRISIIENDLKNTNVRRSIFILDCCFAGAQPHSFRTTLTGEHCRIASTTASGLAYVQRNRVEDPIGIFTRSFMDGLTSSEASSHIDNLISAESIFTYASKETTIRTSGTQEPQILGTLNEPISIYQPYPKIILGLSTSADEKTAYRKILSICRILSSTNPPTTIYALHRSLLSKYPTAFQTLYKLPKENNKNKFTYEYRPVQPNVVFRYIRLMRSLGLINHKTLELSAVGRRLAIKWQSSYNIILIDAIDKYLKYYDISRDDIQHALRKILAGRRLPTKQEVLDYISLGRILPKDELGIVLDLLGYIGIVRMATKHSYFPW